MEASAIFTGKIQIWVRVHWSLGFQIRYFFLVELGKRIYLDLCVNVHRIEAVSRSIMAISSKSEHAQVGVYHRYRKRCILGTAIAAFDYLPFNMLSG
jgi:hypothetical protein